MENKQTPVEWLEQKLKGDNIFSLDVVLQQAKEMEKSKQKAYDILHNNMFSAHINANDFFAYASAWEVTIYQEDFKWVVEHITKYGQDGIDSAVAYIENIEPIKPYLTDRFNEATKELVDRKQEVIGDVDWEFNHYNETGPYRKINKS